MSMELDDLKSAWKSVPEKNNYKKDDILEMMKKKSSSTVKWLFTFTLIEFILVIVFTITSLYNKRVSTNIFSSVDEPITYDNYIAGSLITIIFTLIFLCGIYKTYKKINLNNSVIDLTNQIIKFRKMVNLFIFLILLSLVFVSIPYYYNLGQDIYIHKIDPANFDSQKAAIVGYISVTIAIVFLILISTIYYTVIYFLFLKKLSNNLKELND